MFLIPYEKFENATIYTKDEVLQRIKTSDNFRMCIFFQNTGKKNNNQVDQNEIIKIRPEIRRRNSFVPLIICDIIQGLDNRTYITYIIRPYIYVFVFAVAWLTPLTVLSIISIMQYKNSIGAYNLDLAPMFVFLVSLVSFISVFKFKVPKIKRQLLEMLDAEIVCE